MLSKQNIYISEVGVKMKIKILLIALLFISMPAFAQKETKWETVHIFSGNSIEKTDDFTVKSNKWRIVWMSERENVEIYGGNFIVYLVDGKGDEELLVNAIQDDNGKTIVRKKGTFNFSVNSCLVNWRIEVQEQSNQ